MPKRRNPAATDPAQLTLNGFDKDSSADYSAFDNTLKQKGFNKNEIDTAKKILISQGHTNPKSWLAHIFPLERTNQILPESLDAIQNLEAAFKKIVDNQDKKWGLYHDFDADGNTGAAIFGRLFIKLGISHKLFAPSRAEGFGLKKHKIDQMLEAEVTNVIVLDNGTENPEIEVDGKKIRAIDYLKSKGVSVIIFDHHLCSETPKNAITVNENQPSAATNPDGSKKNGALVTSSLVGLAVGHFFPKFYKNYKGQDLLPEKELEDFVNWVFLTCGPGLVADVGNISNPINRWLLAKSLEQINRYPQDLERLENGEIEAKDLQPPLSLGLEYLRRLSGIREVTADNYGFVLGPILNAASRLGHPQLAAKLLLETDERKAKTAAQRLYMLNNKRKIKVEKAMAEVLPIAEKYFLENPDSPFFAYNSPKTDEGIRGIVAGRLMQMFQKTIAIGTPKNGHIEYSTRAPAGVNFYGLVINPLNLKTWEDNISDFFIGGGGHEVAAGCSIKSGTQEEFIKTATYALENSAAINPENKVVKDLTIAELLDPEKLDKLLQTLEALAPYGHGNPAPLFRLSNVRIAFHKTMGGGDQHLRAFLVDEKGEHELKDSVAFFQTHSKLGKLLQHAHFTDKGDIREISLYDIYFTLSERNQGKKGVLSAQIIDAEDTGRKIQIPVPKPTSEPSPEIIPEQELPSPEKPEEASIKSILKLIEKSGNAQNITEFVFYDTETTGLKPAGKDPSKTNVITQIAGVRVVEVKPKQDAPHGRFYHEFEGKRLDCVKVGKKYYSVETFAKFCLPLTEAGIAWYKSDRTQPYNPALHEYKIDPGALIKTGVEVIREYPDGPIVDWKVGGVSQEIFSPEIVFAEFNKFYEGRILLPFNANFDHPATAKKFENLIKATEETIAKTPEEAREVFQSSVEYLISKQFITCLKDTDIPRSIQKAKIEKSDDEEAKAALAIIDKYLQSHPQLQIWDDAIRGKLKNQLEKAGISEAGLKNSIPYQNIKNPAEWVDLLIISKLFLGELPSHKLDDVTKALGVNFSRSDTQHDAAEDALVLILVANTLMSKLHQSGLQIYCKGALPNFAECWQILLNDFGKNSISTQAVTADDESTGDRLGDIIIKFPAGFENDSSFKLFESAFKTNERNSHSSLTGVRRINYETGEVVLQGYQDEKSSTLQYLWLFNKFVSLKKFQEEFLDSAGNKIIENIFFFDSSGKASISFKGEGTERERTIQNVPLGPLRKSIKYLASKSEVYKTDPEILKRNIELIKVISEYDGVGLAYISDEGVVIKGHLKGESRGLLLIPPKDIQPGEIPEEMTNNLSFLIQLAISPGVSLTTRSFDKDDSSDSADSEDENGDTKQKNLTKVYVNLHADSQVKVSINEKHAELFVYYMRKFNNPKYEDIDFEKIKAGDSFTFAQGVKLEKDKSGKFTFTGSVNQFREVQPAIRNVGWLIYQIESLPSVLPSQVAIEKNQIIIKQPNGISRELFYVLDAAHLEFTAEKDQFIININRLLVDPYHYSSELGKVRNEIKEAQEKSKTKGSVEKTWRRDILHEPAEKLYYTQKTADIAYDAIISGTLESVARSKPDEIFWLTAQKSHYKFDRTNSNAKIAVESSGKLNPQQSSFLNVPKVAEGAEITDQDLLYAVSKIAGSERTPSEVISEGNTIKLKVKTVDAFENREILFYPEIFQSLVAVLHGSTERDPAIDKLIRVFQEEVVVEGQLPQRNPLKRNKTSFELGFASDEELLTHAAKIERIIYRSIMNFSALKAECDDIVQTSNKAKKVLTSRVFKDVNDLLILAHALEGQKARNPNLDINDAQINTILTIAQQISQVEFARHKIGEEAEIISSRIDSDNDRARSLRKAVVEFYIAYAAVYPEFKYDDAIKKYIVNFYEYYGKTAPIDENSLPNTHDLEKKVSVDNKKKTEIAEKESKGYKALQQLKTALESLAKEAKALKLSTSHFSNETMEVSVNLENSEIYELLTQKAPQQLKQQLVENTKTAYEILKKEGWIEEFEFDGVDGFSFIPSEKMKENKAAATARIEELGRGCEALPDYQIISIDTGSLLNLLLSKEAENTNNHDYGHLDLLVKLAKTGKVKFAISDMVLAEFLDSPLPLKTEDLFYEDGTVKEKWEKILAGRPKFVARLKLISEMHSEEQIEIVSTKLGQEYEQVVRENPEIKAKYKDKKIQNLFENKEWEALTHAEMLEAFINHSSLVKKIKNLSLRKHCGELSQADVLKHYQDKYGSAVSVGFLYEGTDCIGRLNERFNKAFVGNTNYRTEFGNLPESPEPQYDPERKQTSQTKFDPSTTKNLGNTHFLSTNGFKYPFIASLEQIRSVWEPADEEVKWINIIAVIEGSPLDENGNEVFNSGLIKFLKRLEREYEADSARGLLERDSERVQNLLRKKHGGRYEKIVDISARDITSESISGKNECNFGTGWWYKFVQNLPKELITELANGFVDETLQDAADKKFAELDARYSYKTEGLTPEEIAAIEVNERLASFNPPPVGYLQKFNLFAIRAEAENYPEIRKQIAELVNPDQPSTSNVNRFLQPMKELSYSVVKKILAGRKRDINDFTSLRAVGDQSYLQHGNNPSWRELKSIEAQLAEHTSGIEKSRVTNILLQIEYLLEHGIIDAAKEALPEARKVSNDVLAYLIADALALNATKQLETEIERLSASR